MKRQLKTVGWMTVEAVGDGLESIWSHTGTRIAERYHIMAFESAYDEIRACRWCKFKDGTDNTFGDLPTLSYHSQEDKYCDKHRPLYKKGLRAHSRRINR